jgi:hypothetical protein
VVAVNGTHDRITCVFVNRAQNTLGDIRCLATPHSKCLQSPDLPLKFHPATTGAVAEAPRLAQGQFGIGEQTLAIRAVEVTSSEIGNAPMLPELLSQILPDQEIVSVTAGGACDTRKCHDAIAGRGAHAVIPPRKNAKPWKADKRRGSRA